MKNWWNNLRSPREGKEERKEVIATEFKIRDMQESVVAGRIDNVIINYFQPPENL